MPEPPATSESKTNGVHLANSLRLVAIAGSVLFLVAAIAVLLSHVQVTDEDVGATRVCGSSFDSVVDRSGWETWWIGDLDEPDSQVRPALVRTSRCPNAVNLRTTLAAILASIGLAGIIVARPRTRFGPVDDAERSGVGQRIARLGTVTAFAGGALTLAGVVSIIVLVADADSTLFLYTDRLVVGVVGLIVLMPTLALFVIGRALALFGAHLAEDEASA